jgi:hypothetical protein
VQIQKTSYTYTFIAEADLSAGERGDLYDNEVIEWSFVVNENGVEAAAKAYARNCLSDQYIFLLMRNIFSSSDLYVR